METLINNIRNECIGYQLFIAKAPANSVLNLGKRLAELKNDYSLNQDEIFSIENKLEKIRDENMRTKLESAPDFEILNNEK